MSEPSLFDMEPIVAPEPGEALSYGRRLTIRQADAIARGQHPLSIPLRTHLPLLGGDATCGGCAHRWAGQYPKCTIGNYVRASHGAATDVRAWWPACRDFAAAPPLSPPLEPTT